jgi:amidase
MLPGDNIDRPEPPEYRRKKALSAYELWQIHKNKRTLRKEYLDRWMATKAVTGTGREMDGIITPAAPYAAPPHGSNRYAFSFLAVLW